MAPRLHITGASGSGTTTLGRALGQRLGVRHFDVDDFYWLPSDPPFSKARPTPDCARMVAEALKTSDGWVISGSLVTWGDRFIPQFDRVIFLYTPTDVRLERLHRRETEEFGAEAVAPGGKMHDAVKAFLAWAGAYDTGVREGRSLPIHRSWLAKLPCPVLELDGTRPVNDLVEAVVKSIGSP